MEPIKTGVCIRHVLTFAMLILLFFSFAVPARAWRPRKYFKELPPLPDYKHQDMTRSWEGLRNELYDKGITLTSTFVCDVLGCVTGGKKQGARYDHSLGWDLNMDLEKAIGMEGAQLHVSGLYRAGRSLSQQVIVNKLVVSSIFGHEQFRFYALYLEQDLFEKQLNIRIGRIAAGDDFAASEIYWIYVSNAIDGVPISLPINYFFSVYPTTAWGARSTWHITDTVYATSGIYGADPDVADDSMHGLDFSLRLRRGVLFLQELAYTPNKEKNSPGLPGHYKACAYCIGGQLDDLYSDPSGNCYAISGQDPQKHNASYGFYVHADQMLYREGPPGTDHGLTAWGITTLAPPDVNLIPYLLNLGVFYKGLIPGRDKDITAFGFSYAGWSPDATHTAEIQQDMLGMEVNPPKYEFMIEFTEKIQITPWLFVQPDIQVIFHPYGTGRVKDALVVGSRFGLTF